MPNVAPLAKRLSRLALAPLAAFLVGCSYLVYIPMLIIVPFLPLIQLAVKLGARYGPLLLMLVEADPHGAHYTPGMIQAGPACVMHANAHHAYQLRTLDEQILAEVHSNHALRALVIVEIAKLTPQWLEDQQRAAHARGESLRIAFVDSRAPVISDHTRRTCAAAGIPLTGTPGLAAALASGTMTHQPSPYPSSTAHAAIMAAAAASFDPLAPRRHHDEAYHVLVHDSHDHRSL